MWTGNRGGGSSASPHDRIDISFVVPVHNAVTHVGPLVRNILSVKQQGVSPQVVLVDDYSTDGSADAAKSLASEYAEVECVVLPENRGAGEARNAGWERVRGRFTMFFDADDELVPDQVARCVRKLDTDDQIDLAFCGYQVNRGPGRLDEGMSFHDRQILRGYLGLRPEVFVTLVETPQLLVFTNYPWNKVLRTDRYKQLPFRFGSTQVHNDILGHWMSLLGARKLFVTKRSVCTHKLPSRGKNLTHRRDADRLLAIDALNELREEFEKDPSHIRDFGHLFWEFSAIVYTWARSQVSDDLKALMDERFSEFAGKMLAEEQQGIRDRGKRWIKRFYAKMG